MDKIKAKWHEGPVSCVVGGLLIAFGAFILAAFVYRMAAYGEVVLAWKKIFGLGGGMIVVGGVLFSKLGTVAEIAVGLAEKKAEDAK